MLPKNDRDFSEAELQELSNPFKRRWRKLLFVAMARNATSPIEHVGLPVDSTVITGSNVGI